MPGEIYNNQQLTVEQAVKNTYNKEHPHWSDKVLNGIHTLFNGHDTSWWKERGIEKPVGELGIMGWVSPKGVLDVAKTIQKAGEVAPKVKLQPYEAPTATLKSNVEIVKRPARTAPEEILYENADNPNIYIANQEEIAPFVNEYYGVEDGGAGYKAWHADPAGNGTALTAAQRDELIANLEANTQPGDLVSAFGKSPQGMLSYGAMAKTHPDKWKLVQFEGESLPMIESEADFPWKYWKAGMTPEEKLEILNQKRAAFGLPIGEMVNGEMKFPWIGLQRKKQGGFLPRAKSGIHIKPENKGKFTETKKRTGKTTEELTHSKNPITRKRAIFAQNAKKWNKK